mgnify:CR=1 FL=1
MHLAKHVSSCTTRMPSLSVRLPHVAPSLCHAFLCFKNGQPLPYTKVPAQATCASSSSKLNRSLAGRSSVPHSQNQSKRSVTQTPPQPCPHKARPVSPSTTTSYTSRPLARGGRGQRLPVQAGRVHLNHTLVRELGPMLLHHAWVGVDEVRALPVLDQAQALQATGRQGSGRSSGRRGAEGSARAVCVAMLAPTWPQAKPCAPKHPAVVAHAHIVMERQHRQRHYPPMPVLLNQAPACSRMQPRVAAGPPAASPQCPARGSWWRRSSP